MVKHDKFCPAYRDADAVREDGTCDCGALWPKETSLGKKMDAMGDGCAVSFGRALGKLLPWALLYWLFHHDIATGAAWVAAHVRIVP